ncbi:hypothetical protein niasHS_017001 [Heterodera schachtii]|uniref:Uncharacterized protein n=1 Tax=Heterodera schachtii TaxID=97005 RepID=A0ABD2I2G7_HETSC
MDVIDDMVDSPLRRAANSAQNFIDGTPEWQLDLQPLVFEVPEAPANNVPEAPANNVPEAPANNVTEAPANNVPEEPANNLREEGEGEE